MENGKCYRSGIFFFPLENQLLKIYHYNIWKTVSLKHYELWMLRQNLIWPLGTQTLT